MKISPTRTPFASFALAASLALVASAANALPPPGLSQGETAPAAICVDTGHARITRMCATVVLRYKIDALVDVPLSNFGITWSPASWTFSQLDGSQRTVPQDKLPAPLAHVLAGTTLQLKGHALVDFSANTPLQFMAYQTNIAPARDRMGWTAAQRTPQERWLFNPSKCGEGPIQSMEPDKAMALYKLGVKSLSVDPKKGATACKANVPFAQLDVAAKALDKLCLAESTRPTPSPTAGSSSGLCLAPTAAGLPTRNLEQDLLRQRWAAQLDDGIAPQLARPSLALLDTPSADTTTASTVDRTATASTTAASPNH